MYFLQFFTWYSKLRCYVNRENNCFISLKDHKEDSQNIPTVRMINLVKKELGNISNAILDKLNESLRENLQLS